MKFVHKTQGKVLPVTFSSGYLDRIQFDYRLFQIQLLIDQSLSVYSKNQNRNFKANLMKSKA